MTSVLDTVRAAVIANRPMAVENRDVVFYVINTETGEKEESERLPGDTATAFHSKATKKSYDLLAVVTCMQYADLSFAEYLPKCRAVQANIVSTVDKKELIAYLKGDIDSSVQVYEPTTAPKRKAADETSTAPDVKSSSITQEGSPSKKAKESKEENEQDEAMKRIMSREYTHRDRTTMMETPKAFDNVLSNFEALLKEEKDKMDKSSGKPSLLMHQAKQVIPLRVAMKNKIPETPIIVVPPGVSDLINMLNVRDFLEDGVYVTTAQKKSEGQRKQASIMINYTDNEETYQFRLVDSVARLNDKDWKSIVGVIVSGHTWQFKGWKWSFPMEVFKRCCGIHIYAHGTSLNEEVKKWDVKILMLHPHKRHLDKVAAREFWTQLFAYIKHRVMLQLLGISCCLFKRETSAMATVKTGKVANKVSPEMQKMAPVPGRRDQVLAHLDGRTSNIVLGLMTIFTLFADDIRVSGFNKSADSTFYVLELICFVFFIIEWGCNVYARPGYANKGMGFTFWMDFIAALSILADVGWITDALVGTSSSNSISSLQASRASRAGTKAGRLVKLIRLIRLIRVSRIFRTKTDAKEAKLNEPSKVGKILTELTTRRLIVLVLVMIIILPIIDQTLTATDQYQANALYQLHRMTQDYNATGGISIDDVQALFNDYVRNCNGVILDIYIYNIDKSITNVWLQSVRFQSYSNSNSDWIASSPYTNTINPITGWSASMLTTDYSPFRAADLNPIFFYDCYNPDGTQNATISCYTSVEFYTASSNASDAQLAVVKTLVIIFVFGFSIYFFTRDADHLVIGPIERMMELVNRLAKNPLGNTDIEEDMSQEYETRMLEKTMGKIGRLLQVGFGSAGTEIISKNMGGTGELNVMIPGKKITSIFGFGIIEHFTETCSVLEESVITYINTLADIVHTDANIYYGAANKNIGAAFLLAWKICDGTLPGMRDPRDSATKPVMSALEKAEKREGISVQLCAAGFAPRAIAPQELVDSALMAVLKMRIDIHNANLPDGRFQLYLNNSKLQEKFDHHFGVHMGFGLHIGWAIEGAIGSKYKIDASYLSPNVNMAARLENATGQFQVSMLISEWFMDELSPFAKNYCRKIDRVTVKGSEIPMDLWTFDIGNYDVDCDPIVDPNGVQMPLDFKTSDVLSMLQENIPKFFFSTFTDGVQAYLDGDWTKAHLLLSSAYDIYRDGPTSVLLNILKNESSDPNGYVCPSWWKGFRPLTEK
ncbi:Voltage-gated Ion Channel (VIC) Superfamily [Thraustotheca clavata]|uniref:Voltage-gated Ion Channel (VIC) Superfamily n=1 Tax=Thraustotheca clavata TaxID=74557 RepID=A0A1V9ZAM8_9STRA|nr:Voltage-gated Ion Channel (VIC) Superfamily [Thraustotheca clavata]